MTDVLVLFNSLYMELHVHIQTNQTKNNQPEQPPKHQVYKAAHHLALVRCKSDLQTHTLCLSTNYALDARLMERRRPRRDSYSWLKVTIMFYSLDMNNGKLLTIYDAKYFIYSVSVCLSLFSPHHQQM